MAKQASFNGGISLCLNCGHNAAKRNFCQKKRVDISPWMSNRPVLNLNWRPLDKHIYTRGYVARRFKSGHHPRVDKTGPNLFEKFGTRNLVSASAPFFVLNVLELLL